MDRKLLGQGLVKFFAGLLIVAALLFVPAGTLRWGNAWAFLGLLFVPMFCAGLVMLRFSPELLRRRLSAKEREGEQRSVVAWSGVMFLVGFLLAGLNRRFGWTSLPRAVVIAAACVFLISYLIYAEVLRENEFLSRTVEVQEGQRVIDTGLYGVVRHPMYAATLGLFLSMPLLLGSWPSLLVFLLYPVLIVRRIRNEEQVLAQGLAGYTDYQQRVRYRLIPFIW